VKSLVVGYEPFAIGQRHLIYKNQSIFTWGEDVTSTWTGQYSCDLLHVAVNGLFNNVVKLRVENLDWAVLSTHNDRRNVPLTCQVLHFCDPEPHRVHFLCLILLCLKLSNDWLIGLKSGSQHWLGIFLKYHWGVLAVILVPFFTCPLFALPVFACFPFRHSSVSSYGVQEFIVKLPAEFRNQIWMIAQPSNFFQGVTVVNVDLMDIVLLTRVCCSKHVTPVWEPELDHSSKDNLSVITKAGLQNMIKPQLITASYGHIVT